MTVIALGVLLAVGLSIGRAAMKRRPRHEPRLLRLLPPSPCLPECGRPRRCQNCALPKRELRAIPRKRLSVEVGVALEEWP